MIALRAQEYSVPGLPKYFPIIYPQDIYTPEGYKGNFIAHHHGDHDGYAELNLKGNKPGWTKAKPVEKFYVNYNPKNSLPTNEATLPNQREK